MNIKDSKKNDRQQSADLPLSKPEREDNYFGSLSKKYKTASKILYFVLAGCFILTLLFNAKLLTYSNFSYLMRDLGSAADLASENYNSISYSNDKLRVTKNFRGGVITASTTDMAIYTATGRKTLNMAETFIEPEIAVSKKYAIIYDLGGNNYSIYNSFARVFHGKMDYPINYIAVSDSGFYAIVSKDSKHSSVVYLYDKDFNLLTTYSFGSKYVFSVALDEKGEQIAITTAEPSSTGEEFISKLQIYDAKKGKLIYESGHSKGIPCGSSFLENGNFRLVTTKDVYTFSKSEKEVKSYNFGESKLNKLSIGNNKCIVSLSAGKGKIKNIILAFDKNGKLIYNGEVNSSIADIKNSKDYIFVNLSNSVIRINIKNGERDVKNFYEIGNDIIVYSNSNILFCCETKAKYIKF